MWEPEDGGALLVYCRAGFEGDAAAELATRAAAAGVAGYCRADPASGLVGFHGAAAGEAARLWREVAWRELVFARQRLWRLADCPALPPTDRAGPLAAAAARHLRRIRAVWIEHPDTQEGRALSRLGRRLAGPLTGALQRAGVVVEPNADTFRLHVLLLAGDHAWLALSDPAGDAPWPQGIPRLRLPREAPSRSALKLDEALLTFLDEAQRRHRLTPGMRAVDLGAAPGGWSWQLARRGLRVTAVDNGPMAAAVLETGLVSHQRADGFRYRPPRPVDWMVCDMVEQPHRVARLAADWLARGDCRETVFNLKLPMRRRHQAVTECLAELQGRLQGAGLAVEVACKQLYHDREEVTVHARRRSVGDRRIDGSTDQRVN